jgi:hypothetical protein
VVDENNIDAILIFCVDESCFSTVQKRAENVLGMNGRQIGAMSSGVKKGQHFIASEILNTHDDIHYEEACCSSATQAGADQLDEVLIQCIAPRFENPNRAKNVTIDVFSSVMKPVPLDNVSSFPKAKVRCGRRKQVGDE